MSAPPATTATITAMRRMGLQPMGVENELECEVQWPCFALTYELTYEYDGQVFSLTLHDTGKGGIIPLVERAVRQDVERRRYLTDRADLVVLPMEVVCG